MLRSSYRVNFSDLGRSDLRRGDMPSSLNFVRSWMTSGFNGRLKNLLTGIIRHGALTDLQVSRLDDAERCHPWDQILKKGLVDINRECDRVLAGGANEQEVMTIDVYRSAVCAQLESWEQKLISPVRVRGRVSAAKSTIQKLRLPAIRDSVSEDTLIPSTSTQRTPCLQIELF